MNGIVIMFITCIAIDVSWCGSYTQFDRPSYRIHCAFFFHIQFDKLQFRNEAMGHFHDQTPLKFNYFCFWFENLIELINVSGLKWNIFVEDVHRR